MLAPLAPKLQDDLGLSNTETAVMISIPVVLGSLLRIPLGVMTDRFGGRVLFGVMLAYSAGACVLVGFASSYAALLGAGFLLGAAGAAFAVGVPFVAEWFPKERQGYALGIYGMGNIGTAVAAFSVPAIRDAASQELAGIVFAVVIAAYALIWFSLSREAPGERPQHPLQRGPAGGLEALAARPLLLRHLRRLRRDGDLPAEAAQGLVRLLADRCRPAGGRDSRSWPPLRGPSAAGSRTGSAPAAS